MRSAMIVTGGAGFIGCHLIRALLNGREPIVAVDNLHPQIHKNSEPPSDFPDGAELVVADVRDKEFWDGFLSKFRPTTVIHLAAETGTGQSLTESTRHASVNVVGLTQMLDAFTRASVVPDHIVLASSRAVYGEGAWIDARGAMFYPSLRSHVRLERAEWEIRSDDGVPANPVAHRAGTVFPNPSSIYGATKLAQENVVSAWASAMEVPVSVLRFQNVYGPGQSPFNPYTGIVTLFHRIARSGAPIDVYEDGQIGRDFVYIGDVVRAVVAAARRPPARQRLLDVGSGEATTILDAANAIARMHGAPPPVISGKFRDGDIRWAVAAVEDLEAELGVGAKVGFLEEGARLVGEWLIAKGYA